jgi:hypothetical protein
LDVVRDGVTGVLADAQTVPSFADAVQRLSAHTWDRSAIREHARRFSEEHFRTLLTNAVRRAQETFRMGK